MYRYCTQSVHGTKTFQSRQRRRQQVAPSLPYLENENLTSPPETNPRGKGKYKVKKLLLCLALLMSSAFASPSCITVQNFSVNNAWTAGQTIPYGMVLEVFNPPASGCDLYITSMTLSAGSNVPYIVFGSAFATSLMPGCAANVQAVDLALPFMPATLPGGISGAGLPCGVYVPIGTVSDARWTLANGKPYEEDFGGRPRKVPPGIGYSIWTSPAGYPTVPSAIGDLTITFDIKTCPLGSAC